MHMLIVEDDPLTALMIVDLLTGLGGDSFDVASTELEAVALAEKHPPDLITADVRLALGCGVRAVLAIQRRTKIPAVYITGNPEALPPALLPVTVVKPITEEALRRAIGRALG